MNPRYLNIFTHVYRPLRNEEALPKQSYKKSIKNVNLLESSSIAPKSKSGEKNGLSTHDKPDKKKKKSKESASTMEQNHDSDNKASEHKKKHKNKEKTKSSEAVEEVNLLGTPVKTKSSKDKTKKEKKSSKKKSDGKSKSGYEEALGISTPSKEIN